MIVLVLVSFLIGFKNCPVIILPLRNKQSIGVGVTSTSNWNEVWQWFWFVSSHLVFKVTDEIVIAFASHWFWKQVNYSMNSIGSMMMCWDWWWPCACDWLCKNQCAVIKSTSALKLLAFLSIRKAESTTVTPTETMLQFLNFCLLFVVVQHQVEVSNLWVHTISEQQKNEKGNKKFTFVCFGPWKFCLVFIFFLLRFLRLADSKYNCDRKDFTSCETGGVRSPWHSITRSCHPSHMTGVCGK